MIHRKLLMILVLLALIGNLENREKGPAFSSPQAEMHENGDRVSPYPPYYRPESSGRR
ncbi:MAG: hypothetical protein AAGU11_15180 [Syntrophobacteraceae bacterium]